MTGVHDKPSDEERRGRAVEARTRQTQYHGAAQQVEEVGTRPKDSPMAPSASVVCPTPSCDPSKSSDLVNLQPSEPPSSCPLPSLKGRLGWRGPKGPTGDACVLSQNEVGGESEAGAGRGSGGGGGGDRQEDTGSCRSSAPNKKQRGSAAPGGEKPPCFVRAERISDSASGDKRGAQAPLEGQRHHQDHFGPMENSLALPPASEHHIIPTPVLPTLPVPANVVESSSGSSTSRAFLRPLDVPEITLSSRHFPDFTGASLESAFPPGMAAAAGLLPMPPCAVPSFAEGQQQQEQRDRLVQLLRAFMLAKHVKTDSQPCKVMEGLFLGSVGAAYNQAALKKEGITSIVVVANSLQPFFPGSFSYTVVDVLDSPEVDLAARFGECFEAIDAARRAGGSALVHCFAGRSRSVTVVTAYVMSRLGLGRDAALEFVRRFRPEACPNAGFMHQLHLWEERLRSQGLNLQSSMPETVGVEEETHAPALPVRTEPGVGGLAAASCPIGASCTHKPEDPSPSRPQPTEPPTN